MSEESGDRGSKVEMLSQCRHSPYSKISLGASEAVAIRIGAAKKPRGGHQALQGQCGCVLVDPS